MIIETNNMGSQAEIDVVINMTVALDYARKILRFLNADNIREITLHESDTRVFHFRLNGAYMMLFCHQMKENVSIVMYNLHD